MMRQKEFENELTSQILHFWVKEVYDSKRRSFYGRIDKDGRKYPEAPLTAILITRILWTFSAAYRQFPTAVYKRMADEAYRILQEWFTDKDHGGIYWSVLPDGSPADTTKQFYAQAFFLYALAEYHHTFRDDLSLQTAKNMFMLMEKHAHDSQYGGYFEACTANWQPTADQYLTPRNSGISKSMNTHLHILEAFTNLYRVWKDDLLEKRLTGLIRIFQDKITHPETFHFILFFDRDWSGRSAIESYGHDIEGSWLLTEAAEVLGDEEIAREMQILALKIAGVTEREAFGPEGGMYYEKEEEELKIRYDWWPQAESVVGFYNAWRMSGKEEYLHRSQKSWKFIQTYLSVKKHGEWLPGVDAQLNPLPQDLVSGWKAPYHNGRMCMEMIRFTRES